jgi:hypothetical protein
MRPGAGDSRSGPRDPPKPFEGEHPEPNIARVSPIWLGTRAHAGAAREADLQQPGGHGGEDQSGDQAAAPAADQRIAAGGQSAYSRVGQHDALCVKGGPTPGPSRFPMSAPRRVVSHVAIVAISTAPARVESDQPTRWRRPSVLDRQDDPPPRRGAATPRPGVLTRTCRELGRAADGQRDGGRSRCAMARASASGRGGHPVTRLVGHRLVDPIVDPVREAETPGSRLGELVRRPVDGRISGDRGVVGSR